MNDTVATTEMLQRLKRGQECLEEIETTLLDRFPDRPGLFDPSSTVLPPRATRPIVREVLQATAEAHFVDTRTLREDLQFAKAHEQLAENLELEEYLSIMYGVVTFTIPELIKLSRVSPERMKAKVHDRMRTIDWWTLPGIEIPNPCEFEIPGLRRVIPSR